jgi:chemotaxis protein methyltransferase CheR
VTWTQVTFDRLARIVSERTGLALDKRQDSAECGAKRAMACAGEHDVERYLSLIASDAKAFDNLIDELTVGETYFFREPAHFEMIRRRILPDLYGSRSQDHVFQVWSAGCATGEEVYSLAILLEQEGLADRSTLLGTDLSRRALAKADSGIFGNWSLRGEGAAQAVPYLRPVGMRHKIGDRIRRRVAFRHHNLAAHEQSSTRWMPYAMDLILCRNVLIYLHPEAVLQVARSLFAALAEGGWLITASSDPPLAELAPFETVVTTDGLLYRRPLALPSTERAQVLDTPACEPVPAPVLDSQPQASAPAAEDVLSAVRTAFGHSEYFEVVRLTQGREHDVNAMAYRVRARANIEAGAAEQTCCAALTCHPLSTELHYLRALLLVNLGRFEEATQSLRQALFLEHTLAAAHFTLGTVLRQRGDLAGARRAYRNAHALAVARSPDEIATLTDAETYGNLAEAALAQLAALEAAGSES